MKERVEQVRQQRATAARGRDRRLMPDGRHRRLHERGQVDAAQRARRERGRAGRGQAVRDARPDAAARSSSATARPPIAHRHGRVHPQAARTSSSTRSGRRSRRSTGPTSCSRSSTRPTRTPPSTARRSRRSSTSSAPATSRASSRSTRSTSSTGAGHDPSLPTPIVGGTVPYQRADRLRPRLAADRARGAPRVALGRRRRRRPVRRGRAARAGPRARHGRARVSRRRCPRPQGRVAPALAGELEAAAARAARNGTGPVAPPGVVGAEPVARARAAGPVRRSGDASGGRGRGLVGRRWPARSSLARGRDRDDVVVDGAARDGSGRAGRSAWRCRPRPGC